MKITLGADPEVFFSSEQTPVSAIGLIGGSKHDPKSLGEGFAILEDNVAAEYNIPPASNIIDFSRYVERGLNHVIEHARKYKLGISRRASYSFTSRELDNPQAQEFGCEPDFDAWTKSMNIKPEATDGNFRTCGGHIHVGGVEHLDPFAVIRAMDLFLGVPSVFLDTDKDRRQLYGKAGAFRPKDYGVEYRTLSNFWIFDPKLRYWVANATINAVEYAEKYLIESDSSLGELIRYCINESDMDVYFELKSEYPEIEPILEQAA